MKRLSRKDIALLTDKVLVNRDRALANTSQDHTAHAILERLHSAGVHLIQGHAGGCNVLQSRVERTFPALRFLTKDSLDGAGNKLGILLKVVDNSVRACIKGVRADGPADCAVDVMDKSDGSTRDVVHVEDRRPGVQASSVEAVGVAHGDLCEGGEIAVLDSGLDGSHPLWDNSIRPGSKEVRGSDGRLHTLSAGDILLCGTDNQNDGTHFRPVRLRGNLLCQTVASILQRSSAPGDITTHQRAAGGARALTSDAAQVTGRLRQLVEVCHGTNEGRKPGGRAGETGGGGEVVLGDNAEREGGQLGQRGVGILELATVSAQAGQTSKCTLGGLDVLGLAVQGELVLGGVERSAGSGGESAEGTLRKGDGEGRIRREVENSIALAPVPIQR